MSTHAEELRWRIDEAIDEWLQANGLTGDEIADLDYQYVNEALDDLLDKQDKEVPDEMFYSFLGMSKDELQASLDKLTIIKKEK